MHLDVVFSIIALFAAIATALKLKRRVPVVSLLPLIRRPGAIDESEGVIPPI